MNKITLNRLQLETSFSNTLLNLSICSAGVLEKVNDTIK